MKLKIYIFNNHNTNDKKCDIDTNGDSSNDSNKSNGYTDNKNNNISSNIYEYRVICSNMD